VIFIFKQYIIKAACDRMAGDCGIELKKFGVTMISLYPGPVKTELIANLAKNVPKVNK
jgi:dehydrogenase/reductase SDR family protein 1